MKTDKNRPQRGDRSRPTITVATIVELSIREFDNRVTCEVVDALGNFHKNVETIMQGGGTPTSFTSSPYVVGQEVYLIQMSHNEPPYIIGSVFKSSSIVPSMDVEFSDAAQDRNVVGVRDYVISNRGNMLNLSDYYGAIISANRDIRLQLGQNGILRISKDGLCDDYPIRGAAFITALHNYLEEIRAVQDQIKAMQTDITANIQTLQSSVLAASLAISAPPPPAVPGSPPVITTALGTLAETLATITTSVGESVADNTALQALPIRDGSTAGQEAVETLCTSIKLPKTPE